MNQHQTDTAKKPSHWQIIAPVKRGIYVAMAIAVVSVFCSLLAMLSLANIVQIYIDTGSVGWWWFLLSLGIIVLAYLSRGISFRQSHLAAFALEPILRRQITQRLAQVSLGVIGEQGSGALTKVIQDDVRELHVFVADSTPLYARAFAAPLLTAVLLLWIDWRLAFVAIGVLVVGMLILKWVIRGSEDIHTEFNNAREDVNRAVVEFVQAMPVVRTFDGGKTSFGRYETALDTYKKIVIDWYKMSGKPARLSMMILNPMPTLVLLLWAGAYFLWQDSLNFATWVAVLLLGTGMAEALMPYMALFHMIEKSKISISRLLKIQNLPILPVSKQAKMPADTSIGFDAVDFRYASRNHNALTNISFNVPAGSFTALVGSSGAGKSTVARLIPRFWDVSAGSVKVGGVDVRDIAPEQLMQQVAFVFQDNFLFSGTIADNIKLGQADKGMPEVIAAAQAAQAHDFIEALPDGYQTAVGERGASLSGGQRQRITIARAILQNRPILVLDEATAFADAENEALLMKALHALMQNKTVLMIAHRLATIQHADQILVFKDGRLAEAGAPQELLAQNGEYATLWQAYQQAQQWTMTN